MSAVCGTHTHVGARPVPSWTPDPARRPTPWTRASRNAALEMLLQQRILVLDGAMGTMIQAYLLEEADFRGERFATWHKDLRGNNDVLALTRPDIIQDLHAAYLEAGEFPVGSMGPKIEAALDFLERGGKQVLITDGEHLEAGLAGTAGTRIVA